MKVEEWTATARVLLGGNHWGAIEVSLVKPWTRFGQGSNLEGLTLRLTIDLGWMGTCRFPGEQFGVRTLCNWDLELVYFEWYGMALWWRGT